MRSRASTAGWPPHGLGAQISAPGVVAGADRRGELLAVPVGARQPAEIGAVAGPGAGHEEGHVAGGGHLGALGGLAAHLGAIVAHLAGTEAERQEHGARRQRRAHHPVHVGPP